MRPTALRPLAGPLAAVLVILVAAGARQLRTRAMGHYLETQRYEDIYYLPPAEWLPVFSLGHDEAAASLLWMRALIYYGDELIHEGKVEHVFDYTDGILELDPTFRRVYHWAGMSGMYYAGEIDVEDIRRAIHYLELGARRFPDDGEMAWDLGASLAYELAPRIEDPEDERRVRQMGVEHMLTAARLGAGPDWLVLTNATELQRLGETEQAIRHLEEMYATVQSPELKREIEWQLRDLRSQAHAEAFRRAHEELEQRRRRDFPYLPTALYQLVGPRPPVEMEGPIPDPWDDPCQAHP